MITGLLCEYCAGGGYLVGDVGVMRQSSLIRLRAACNAPATLEQGNMFLDTGGQESDVRGRDAVSS